MKVLLAVAGLAFIGVVGLFVAARVAKRPVDVGRPSGPLAPCSGRSNCVSSQSNDLRTALAPIPFTGGVAEAHARLAAIVRGIDGATVVTETEEYLYAEVRSRLFGFVDDVEFRFDGSGSVIHFRCASRIGRRDFGVNRRRMELIHAVFLAR